MASPLNREGYDNLRNLAKPFRAPGARPTGQVVPSPVGPVEMYRRTPGAGMGCYKSRGSAPRVKLYGPKKGRRVEKKRKHVCRLATSREIDRAEDRRIDRWIKLRAGIHAFQLKCQELGLFRFHYCPSLGKTWFILNGYLLSILDSKEWDKIDQADRARKASVGTQFRANHITPALNQGKRPPIPDFNELYLESLELAKFMK